MIFEIVVWVLQHMLMGGLNNLGTFPQKIPLPSLDDYSFWQFVLLTGCLRSKMSNSTFLNTLQVFYAMPTCCRKKRGCFESCDQKNIIISYQNTSGRRGNFNRSTSIALCYTFVKIRPPGFLIKRTQFLLCRSFFLLYQKHECPFTFGREKGQAITIFLLHSRSRNIFSNERKKINNHSSRK